MEFRKGNKVEVLRRTKEQTHSWFPGKITSVYGDHYIVKYEKFLNLEGELVVEKVNREDVRPLPPKTKKEEKWMAGDIAEVFDTHCWRAGKVVKVQKSDQFVIRLFGSIQLKGFHHSSLRVRQAWQNYKWVMIGKVIGGDKKCTINNSPNYSLGLHGGATLQYMQKESNSREKKSQEHLKAFHSMNNLKRNPSSHIDGVVRESANKRRKMTMKAGGCDGLPVETLPLSSEVYIKSSAETNERQRCTLGSYGNHTELEKKANYIVGPFSIPPQTSEDSDGCSVASCSSNGFLEYTVQTGRKSFKDIIDSSCDDAESLCPCASLREYVPSEDALEANIRELEVNAYRRTLQALYASGPLSWEQESLLTNLRLSLHVSNEDHLLLLRQLLSTQDS